MAKKETKKEIAPVDNSCDVSVNDLRLTEEDAEVLDLLRPGKFDIRNFHEEFQGNAKRVLFELISMQNNEYPLKKGGEGIAYRCSVLILQNRQQFSANENTLLDILIAKMSSAPQDRAYFISLEEIREHIDFNTHNYIYAVVKDCIESLSNKPLIFHVDLENGNRRIIKIPWFSALTYVSSDQLSKDEERTYVSFTPTDLFKALAISSGISHGAYYSVKAASQIANVYAKVLFYFLALNKNYREYPNATPGKFSKTADYIMKELLQCPKSYRWADVNRRVFKPLQEKLSTLENVDFNFNYEKKGNKIYFDIYKIEALPEQVVDTDFVEKPEAVGADQATVYAILAGHGFDDKECATIYSHYVGASRDIPFLTQAIVKLVQGKSVQSRVGVMCYLMDNGLDATISKAGKKSSAKKKVSANQRQYDFDELESLLLNTDAPG